MTENNIRGSHFVAPYLSISMMKSVMIMSYIEPEICVAWFLLLGKVLFTFSMSSSGNFHATVAVRTLFRVFHNGYYIPIKKLDSNKKTGKLF